MIKLRVQDWKHLQNHNVKGYNKIYGFHTARWDSNVGFWILFSGSLATDNKKPYTWYWHFLNYDIIYRSETFVLSTFEIHQPNLDLLRWARGNFDSWLCINLKCYNITISWSWHISLIRIKSHYQGHVIQYNRKYKIFNIHVFRSTPSHLLLYTGIYCSQR